MKLTRDLHLGISKKLHNTVSVKVFAHRTARADPAERVCLGTLHMPEQYLSVFRHMLESGAAESGGRVTVGGSYVSMANDAARPEEALTPP